MRRTTSKKYKPTIVSWRKIKYQIEKKGKKTKLS